MPRLAHLGEGNPTRTLTRTVAVITDALSTISRVVPAVSERRGVGALSTGSGVLYQERHDLWKNY